MQKIPPMHRRGRCRDSHSSSSSVDVVAPPRKSSNRHRSGNARRRACVHQDGSPQQPSHPGIRRIDSAFAEFKARDWILVESDGADGTADEIRSVAATMDLQLISHGRLRDRHPRRTHRLAVRRNTYLEVIEADAEAGRCDFVGVVDLDGVSDALSQASIHACWDAEVDWDACFANQSGPHDDMRASRHSAWSPGDWYEPTIFFVNMVFGSTRRSGRLPRSPDHHRSRRVTPGDGFRVRWPRFHKRRLIDGARYIGKARGAAGSASTFRSASMFQLMD